MALAVGEDGAWSQTQVPQRRCRHSKATRRSRLTFGFNIWMIAIETRSERASIATQKRTIAGLTCPIREL